MAAQLVDAIKGYEYFLKNRGKLSNEDVNKFLEDIGRTPISKRMYGHYNKLIRLGFRSYIPINQFDVSRTRGQLQMLADRRRYEREPTQIDSLISSDGTNWIKANIIDKSLVGFGMYTADPIPFKRGTLIWVRIEQFLDIPMILVWKNTQDGRTRFGLRSLEFIARYRISDKRMLIDSHTGQLIVRRTSEAGITWREFFRIMAKVDELIDASSELLDSIAETLNRDVKFTPAIISSIKFSSPVEVILNIDYKIIIVIIVLIKTIQLWRLDKEYRKELNRTIKLDNDLREIEIARKAIKSKKDVADLDITKHLSDTLSPSLKKALNIDQLPSTLFEPGSSENGILTERVVPAAAELLVGDDPDIEVVAKESDEK